MDNDIKGNKHICSNCGTKFYDLNKLEIICPKCGEKKKEKLSFEDNNTLQIKEPNNVEKNEILEDELGIIEDEDKDDHIIDVE